MLLYFDISVLSLSYFPFLYSFLLFFDLVLKALPDFLPPKNCPLLFPSVSGTLSKNHAQGFFAPKLCVMTADQIQNGGGGGITSKSSHFYCTNFML